MIQQMMCPSKGNQAERTPVTWTYTILIWFLGLLSKVGLMVSLPVVCNAFAVKLPQQGHKHEEMNQQEMCQRKYNQRERESSPVMWTDNILSWLVCVLIKFGLMLPLFSVHDSFVWTYNILSWLLCMFIKVGLMLPILFIYDSLAIKELNQDFEFYCYHTTIILIYKYLKAM